MLLARYYESNAPDYKLFPSSHFSALDSGCAGTGIYRNDTCSSPEYSVAFRREGLDWPVENWKWKDRRIYTSSIGQNKARGKTTPGSRSLSYTRAMYSSSSGNPKIRTSPCRPPSADALRRTTCFHSNECTQKRDS